ncbi:unnamed protein product [Rhizoctonia solani]|uniref:FBD domain-containing protein n=1 Tax=Rhizoctonia solani TaxID=456999 RepID=A0A8H3GG35_9AGAM|nr:unnamed protein product [Rhizoctonia solani]
MALLRSSPDLESIVLNIEGEHAPYSPTLVLEPLGIGCPLEDVSSDGMDLDELSRLLPSVKHLACPLFLCEAVIISKLATQLESLNVSDSSPGKPDDAPFAPLLKVMTEDSLPNLRKLAIWDDFSSYLLEAEVLEVFFLAAKGLEELEFRIDVDDYDEFLSILSGARNLQRITMDQHPFREYELSDDAWGSMMAALAEACPLLERIVHYHGIDSWAVVRSGSDQPTIEKIETRFL